MSRRQYDDVATPVGPLRIVVGSSGVEEIRFPRSEPAPLPDGSAAGNSELLEEARRQLVEYFERRRRSFDLPLAPRGTEFQQEVWRALREIPFGETISYGELARRVGRPQAQRAVGAANGRNPISIVIPCHRVIGADGTLTGFGGGLHTKQVLLDLESPLFGALSAASDVNDAP